MKYMVILASSLLIYSGVANAQSDGKHARGQVDAVKSSMFGGMLATTAGSKEQPCQLSASSQYAHRHLYDEDAYLRRISYKN